jgi:hypothetical protein
MSKLQEMSVCRHLLMALALLLIRAAIIEAADVPNAATGGPTTTKVTVGFYLHALREVDWGARTFVADLYWWLRYPQPSDESECAKIEAVEFVNAHAGDIVHKMLERKVVQASHGPEVYVHYRTVASFFFDANYRKYPFDQQVLPIVLEHETLGTGDLEFVYDHGAHDARAADQHLSGISRNLQIPDFHVLKATQTVGESRYDTNFGDPTLATGSFRASRVTLALEIRPYLVFFIPAVNLEVASGLTVSSLLTCVAIQLTVVPGLPQVGYLVVSDLIFYLAYGLSMLAMAQTVWSYLLEKHGHALLAHRLEVACRFLYPALFLLGTLGLIQMAG